MQYISFNKEHMTSLSKEDFIKHFSDNGYDWSEVDILAYYAELHPTPAKPAKNDPKPGSNTTPTT